MTLYIKCHGSGYEAEHTARMFFSEGKRVPSYPKGRQDAVVVHVSAASILCAVRKNGVCTLRREKRASQDEKETEYATALLLYTLLGALTGIRPPWGLLTGVRPVRLMHDMRKQGRSPEEIQANLCGKFHVLPEKFALAKEIALLQEPIMQASAQVPRQYSLYISIPFCPSRCSYCSFVSRTTAQSAKLIAPYVEALCKELAQIAGVARRNHMQLATVYFGGGTPTAIDAQQLRRLMACVQAHFPLEGLQEYTVEAGRPDCTTPEKLQIMKEYGATRISINPQTMSNTVLAAIGRKHTAQDIVRCFEDARAAGHNNINMDLIAGLPLDTPEGFSSSLKQVMDLQPENITVHTLTLKRASNLVIDSAEHLYGDVSRMVETAQKMLCKDYSPYYLYRQKGTLGNLENTGFTKKGFTGLYNVYIMEEIHTILSAGAGGSTKLVCPDGVHISRVFNHKYPLDYLNHFEVVTARKEGVDAFYGKYFNLDSQASG